MLLLVLLLLLLLVEHGLDGLRHAEHVRVGAAHPRDGEADGRLPRHMARQGGRAAVEGVDLVTGLGLGVRG